MHTIENKTQLSRVSGPINVAKPKDKDEEADEKAVSNFANADKDVNCPVEIILRPRPFQKNEKLDKERNKISYLVTGNLI